MLVELRLVEQRYQAVCEVLNDEAPVTDVARRYGVARQTVHQWLRRYAAQGLQGLADRPSRPLSCSHQMDPVVEARIVELRRAHPGWGPMTIGYWLAADEAAIVSLRSGLRASESLAILGPRLASREAQLLREIPATLNPSCIDSPHAERTSNVTPGRACSPATAAMTGVPSDLSTSGRPSSKPLAAAEITGSTHTRTYSPTATSCECKCPSIGQRLAFRPPRSSQLTSSSSSPRCPPTTNRVEHRSPLGRDLQPPRRAGPRARSRTESRPWARDRAVEAALAMLAGDRLGSTVAVR